MKKWTRWIAPVLVLALLVTTALASTGQIEKLLTYRDIKITVDGKEIIPTDVNGNSTEPFIIDGTVYIPVRASSEALGSTVDWNEETNTVEITSGTSAPVATESINVRANGSAKITDPDFDYLFGGNAEKGVAALVAAGAVTVNGTAVNGKNVPINGADALWQNTDGTWSWKTHIMTHGENQSYEEASVAFVVGLSRLRGPLYTLNLKNGQVVGIDFYIYDGAFAKTVTIGTEFTTVKICGEEGDGSMNRANPSTIRFPTALVEPDSKGVMPSDGCLVLYWQDQAGWHLKRADSVQITAPAGYSGPQFAGYQDSLLNLEYSQPWNRPSQPIAAISMIEEESAEMIMWFYCDGIVSAFSRANAYADLPAAIKKAEAALASVPVSAAGDGSDVDTSKPWVSQKDHDDFAKAIETVKAVYANKNLSNSDYEEWLYYLACSYGATGGMHGSGGGLDDGRGYMVHAQRNVVG